MNAAQRLRAEADKRILIKDGAYGTEVQQRRLKEADYRGGGGRERGPKGPKDPV